MSARFSSDVVLVTGATGGRGASHVRGYHAEGARVVVASRHEDAGEALVDELGDRAAFARLDVTEPGDWGSAVAVAEAAFGPVSVLVNNAGLQTPPAPIEHTDPADWARVAGTVEHGFTHMPAGCSLMMERVARQHVLENVRRAVR